MEEKGWDDFFLKEIEVFGVFGALGKGDELIAVFKKELENGRKRGRNTRKYINSSLYLFEYYYNLKKR